MGLFFFFWVRGGVWMPTHQPPPPHPLYIKSQTWIESYPVTYWNNLGDYIVVHTELQFRITSSELHTVPRMASLRNQQFRMTSSENDQLRFIRDFKKSKRGSFQYGQYTCCQNTKRWVIFLIDWHNECDWMTSFHGKPTTNTQPCGLVMNSMKIIILLHFILLKKLQTML